MQVVRFVNSLGEEIQLDFREPFILQQINGTGELEADVVLQRRPMQNGSNYLGSYIGSRSIDLTVTLVGGNKQELYELRSRLNRVFNPSLKEGYLYYETPIGVKKINAIVETSPTYSNFRGDIIVALISLICPNPFWTDESEKECFIENTNIGFFEFPFNNEFELGLDNSIFSVVNDGNVETPVIIEVKGKVINPKIINHTTNEYIQINKTIEHNETLLINTYNRTIKLINSDGLETNAFKWYDLNSKFFTLNHGSNDIEYSFKNEEGSSVMIKWNNLYTGI